MAGVAVFVGALVGVSLNSSLTLPILLAFLAAAFVTAGGNTMNDYFDREVDATSISHKKRPIPSGELLPKEAIQFAAFCFILGIFLSIFINLLCLIIASVNAFFLVVYDAYLKGRGFSGNIIISYLVASTFLFGGAAVGELSLVSALTLLFAMAFLANLGREIVKDVEDIASDKGKRKTLPMKIGEKGSVMGASLSLGVAVVLSPLPLIWEVLGQGYLLVIVADAVLTVSIFTSFRDAHAGQKLIKVGMLLALIAFILGGIT